MIDNERIESIRTIRICALKFIKGEIRFEEFYDKITFELGSTFDPLDLATEDLANELQVEIKMYSKVTGGEFGETENLIPKNPNWEYGKSVENFAWVDKEEYRNLVEAV